VAQEASAEVVMAGVGCGRKKKTLQRREKGWKEKRESRGGSLVVGWWLCWLPVVELVVEKLVVVGTTRRERERKNCINGGRGAGFWPTLDPIFSSLRP
jgi:hypothetical protein